MKVKAKEVQRIKAEHYLRRPPHIFTVPSIWHLMAFTMAGIVVFLLACDVYILKTSGLHHTPGEVHQLPDPHVPHCYGVYGMDADFCLFRMEVERAWPEK